MSARSRRIEVAIDELVLHGFDPRHRADIAEAVRAELATALEGWSPAAGASATYLDAGSFAVPAAAPPALVGRGVARQISQILQPGPRTGTQLGTHQAGAPEGTS